VKGVVESRWAVVNADELSYKSGLSVGDQNTAKAALTAMGVVVR
jgi:hypothetical protein